MSGNREVQLLAAVGQNDRGLVAPEQKVRHGLDEADGTVQLVLLVPGHKLLGGLDKLFNSLGLIFRNVCFRS